mgnify:CR=1 FL=1
MGYKYCSEGHVMDPSWRRCPICLAPLSGWLVTLEDNRPGKVYTIHEGKSFVGGGADCEIRILNKGLSRQHAYLTVMDGICTLVDLGNGGSIRVNNADTVKTTLIDGDIVVFGDLTLKIKLL